MTVKGKGGGGFVAINVLGLKKCPLHHQPAKMCHWQNSFFFVSQVPILFPPQSSSASGKVVASRDGYDVYSVWWGWDGGSGGGLTIGLSATMNSGAEGAKFLFSGRPKVSNNLGGGGVKNTGERFH